MFKFIRRYGALILVYLIGAALVITFFAWPHKAPPACDESSMSIMDTAVQLYAGSQQRFDLEYAKTPPAQELGLSNRPCIPTNAALVFLFPNDDRFGIWMKDMKFPIDVVWLDKDKKIVTIDKNMDPGTYPKVFYPTDESRFVIEFASGTMNKLGAHTGSQLTW